MKNYYFSFGPGNPASSTGLSPTLTIFAANGVTSLVAPGITETPAGSGLYHFTYGPTQSILFLVDGGATLSTNDRYVRGALDPFQIVDEQVGTPADSFGSTNVDPTTLFGQAKRNQEFNEGNSTFDKQTGLWDILSRGSSTLLAEKTLTNSLNSATKT